MGHTSFVTSIIEVNDCLVSSSGDGSVKLWDPLTGEELSSLKCPTDGQFVNQMVYVKSQKSIYATITGQSKLLRISTHDKILKLEEVKELSSHALWMCTENETVVLLLDNDSCPLRIISCSEELNNNLNDAITHINSDLSRKWKSFEGSSKQLNEFFLNLTKMNMENVEEQMERKGKRPPSHIEKSNNEPEVKKSVKSAS